jgi:hypothetical protein
MESSVLHSLPIGLVAAGLVLLGISFLLNQRATDYRGRMKKMLQLANQPLEPLEIPAAAWPLLAGSGWRHLRWEGSWFGQPVAGELGYSGKPRLMETLTSQPGKPPEPLCIEVCAGDEVRLQLTFLHIAPDGETRMFAEHLARVFILLLESRLRERTEALSAALAERAQLSLYLQHDMRNLAQWVNWISADFAACTTPEALLAAARRLRDNAPLAQERAERLFAALGQRPASDPARLIDLRQAVTQAAQMTGLSPEINGEAQAWVAGSLLARALDNLFSNLAKVWRTTMATNPQLTLTMTTPTAEGVTMAELRFHCPWPLNLAPLPAEKIFEPFSSGRPGGLGLGLYQARRSLRTARGDLLALPGTQGIDFLLRLPASADTA